MKKILGIAIALVLVAGTAWAAKTTYIVNNGRMNWVKIKEVSAAKAAALNLSHPATLSEAGIRAALASPADQPAKPRPPARRWRRCAWPTR